MPYPEDQPKRGEVYRITLDLTVGSEQSGQRPALVISPDIGNRQLNTVVIAAITSQIRDRASVVAPLLPAGHPLALESAVLTFQIRTVDKQRLQEYLGQLTDAQMALVNRGLAVSFGLVAYVR